MAVWHRAGYAALWATLTLFLCHSWFGPDIWYHLAWGRSLFEQSRLLPEVQTLIAQPIFANPYWIFQLGLYAAFRLGGIYLVSALFLGTWLIIAGLWLRVSHAAQTSWGPLLFGTFIVCVQLRFEQRPEVFSYLLLLLFIRRLIQIDAKLNCDWSDLRFLFVLQWVWTGVHGYFALGPLLCLAWAIAQICTGQWARWRTALWLFGTSVLATLTTPFGWSVWQAVIAYAKVGAGLRDLNQELFAPQMFPLGWPLTLFWMAWLSILVLSFWSLYRRRDHSFAALLALGGVVLSAEAVRNVPLLFFLSAPLLSAPLMISKQAAPTKIAVSLGALIASLLLIWAITSNTYYRVLGSLSSFGIHLEWASYPIGAADYLLAHRFKGRIFCDSYDGGYLEYALPDAHVAGDSYFSDAAVTHAYFKAIKDPAQLAELHARLNFDALLINIENLPILEWVLNQSGWALVYNDSHRALFMPGNPSPPPVGASYWHGDDLRSWNNAIGPLTWTAIARRHQWRDVLLKILRDVEPSPAIPATLIRQTLTYALDTRDLELAETSRRLIAKTYAVDSDDEPALSALVAKVPACCH